MYNDANCVYKSIAFAIALCRFVSTPNLTT